MGTPRAPVQGTHSLRPGRPAFSVVMGFFSKRQHPLETRVPSPCGPSEWRPFPRHGNVQE